MRPIVLTILTVFCVSAEAQHGGATTGYYPTTYGGSTFTGTLTDKDVNANTLTLTYTKKDKTEVFTGRLDAPCAVPPLKEYEHRLLTVAEMPLGTVMVVYYNMGNRKVDGKKVREYVIIGIRALEVDHKKIPEETQIISFCTRESGFAFRAY